MFWLGKSIKTILGNKIRVSPIEYIILAHLRSRELQNINQDPVGQYGYEMIQELNSLFEGSWKAKSGTIYPILTKMDKEKDLLKAELKKSPLGPVKKIYNLTENGRKLIDDIVKENLKGDIRFLLKYVDLLYNFNTIIEEDDTTLEIIDKIKEIIPEVEDNLHEEDNICPTCGDMIPSNAKFCPSCGNKIS